jgi:transcriptional regulator with XRE-family HTH domain
LSIYKSSDAVGFAQRLTQAREAAGLSRRALGRIAQVSEAHISRVELGQRLPSPVMRQALARALGVDAEWLGSGRGTAQGLPARGLPAPDPDELTSPRLPPAIERLLARERLASEVGRLPRPYVQRYLQRVEAVRAEADGQLEAALRDLSRRIERELSDFRARLLAEWRAERRQRTSDAGEKSQEDDC